MTFISDNLSKHLEIGMLSATVGWLDKAEPKINSDVLSFDAASLRFVDLLTLSQD